MKTTLTIDPTLMIELKAEAARQGRTMSDLVEAALRVQLRPTQADPGAVAPLPTVHGGPEQVDVADREALDRVLDEA